MAVDVTRRRFTQGSIAVGGGLALAGPISALAANTAQGQQRRSAGYGPLSPTPEDAHANCACHCHLCARPAADPQLQ